MSVGASEFAHVCDECVLGQGGDCHFGPQRCLALAQEEDCLDACLLACHG